MPGEFGNKRLEAQLLFKPRRQVHNVANRAGWHELHRVRIPISSILTWTSGGCLMICCFPARVVPDARNVRDNNALAVQQGRDPETCLWSRTGHPELRLATDHL